MMSYRRNLIILIFSILVYFILNFCYKFFFLDSNIKQITILKKDALRGEEITADHIDKISVSNVNLINEYSILDLNNINGKVLKCKLSKGQILSEDMFVKREEYISSNNEKETISIKISNSDDIASFQVFKGSYINIYYTGKSTQLQNILNQVEAESISSSSQIEGYTTIKLLNEIEVVNVFDKYGNNLDIKKSIKNDSSIIDTIMLEVDKTKAMSINNLKKYGEFSVSIVK